MHMDMGFIRRYELAATVGLAAVVAATAALSFVI